MPASADEDATLPGDETSLPGGMGLFEGWLMPGAPVGRYMVLSRLGAGGMGVVYAAYDPELDRKVALKLLRPSPGVHEGTRVREHQLLKQEAQALAKLAHPNVIAIHDVGDHEGRVFLAMEFVDGETLGQWIKQEHTWRETLEMFLCAGEGLRAAHEQGLVHRDFKPENAMVAKDGRVRVMDFGLACHVMPLETLPDAPAEVGGLAGTPAYMAPEQLMGKGADARSDQFSFCVGLWEGLYGTRPFMAPDVPGLLCEIIDTQIQAPARRVSVPGWVRRVMLVGLHAEPARRHASMDVLLSALRRDPSRARRRVAGVGAVVALVGAGWGGVAWNDAREVAACEAEGRTIEQDWGPEPRMTIERAITRHDVAFAEETWERVAPRLDAYAERWRVTSEAACRAHRVEERWSPALFARASECLAERRAAFASMIEVLSDVDLEGLLLVREALGALPPLDACLDDDGLGRRSAPHPEHGPRALQVRLDTARAEVEWHAGHQAEGSARLELALAEAHALADPELVALVEETQGQQLLDRGDHERGVQAQRNAYLGWGRLANSAAQARLASNLARSEATYLGRLDVAELWLDHAAMLHERVAGPGAAETVQLMRARATLAAERGDYETAIVLAGRALEQAELELGFDHPSIEAMASTVMDIEIRRGNYDAARRIALDGLERQRRTWGEHHPEVARTLINLSIVESLRGELEAAQRHAEDAVALTEQSLGPDHPRTAGAVQALATVQSKRGELKTAIAGYERALAVYDRYQPANAEDLRASLGGLLVQHGDHGRAVALLERVLETKRARLGRDSPELINVLINLGAAQRGGGDVDAAAETYREALRVGEAALAPDHPMLAYPLNNLGSIERERGRLDQARKLLSRALEIRLAKLGPHHLLVASTLETLALVDLDEHDPKAALARLDQARQILLAAGADPLRRAQVELKLVRVLVADGSDRARALALVQGCEQAFAGPGNEESLALAQKLRRTLEGGSPGATSP